MEKFIKQNTYFGGKVQSLEFESGEGRATVGVIKPGKYSFSTDTEEDVLIISGKVRVKLPDKEWVLTRPGENYVAPKGVTFEIETESDAAYLCRFK